MQVETFPINSPAAQVERIRSGIPRPVEALIVAICLCIALPFIILLSLAVMLSSRGPLIFRQVRVGRGGKKFTLYKLRTMRCAVDGVQITAADDERTTRVGRALRRTKLDELPELWNVLKGDMSLVGPRPEVPRYVDLENQTWRQVLAVRPGLTDPVTILLRHEEELLAMVEGDRESFYLEHLQPFKLKGCLEYLQRRSWLTDARVLWETCLTFIIRRRPKELLRMENISDDRRLTLVARERPKPGGM